MTAQSKRAVRAADLMTQPVFAIEKNKSIHELARLFTQKKIGAATVLDGQGNPIGVITKTDLVRHEVAQNGRPSTRKNPAPAKNLIDLQGRGVLTAAEAHLVEHWMTPIILSVPSSAPLREIAKRMVRFNVHHIFVRETDATKILGIVSTFDILRHLAAESEPMIKIEREGL